MRVVNINHIDDSLVLHFQTEGKRINAYTLATTLVAFADAAKAANSNLNIGFDVEIVVEAIGPGSFRATLRTVYTKGKNLFSDQKLQGFILAIIANFVYERTLAVDDNVSIEINTDEVVIERGDEKIIVPRVVHDATRNVEKSPQFINAIGRSFDAISRDTTIDSFGFARSLDAPEAEILISREAIGRAAILPQEDPLTRTIHEQCSLQIVKAILEKSRRKWEFMWRGIKISAPNATNLSRNACNTKALA